MSRLYLLALFSYFIHLCAGSGCYSQSGELLLESFIPCGSHLNTGACCNGKGGDGVDLCTSAGLCLRQAGSPGFLYQDGCTDKNWGPSCPQFCPGKSGVTMMLQQCSDSPTPGTWCCKERDDENDCCGNDDAVFTTDVGSILLPTATVLSWVPPSTVTVTATHLA